MNPIQNDVLILTEFFLIFKMVLIICVLADPLVLLLWLLYRTSLVCVNACPNQTFALMNSDVIISRNYT